MNKILQVWAGLNANTIENIKKDAKLIKHIYYECVSEIDFHKALSDFKFFEELTKVCADNNIKLTTFVCLHPELETCDFNFNDDVYKNVNFVYWPTYFFTRTFDVMTRSPDYEYNCKVVNYDIKNDDHNLINKNIKFLYSNYNNIAKFHRIITMDTLAKYNLIEKGYISWRDIVRIDPIHLVDKPNDMLTSYFFHSKHYKHWTPKILTLDQGPDAQFNQEILPQHYTEIFMDIVTESDDNKFFISEKTVKPLLTNQLFLVVSCKNFHKKLSLLGFKLYDEIFDYSFDSENDINARVEGVVNNIKKYENYSNKELLKLINLVEEKIRFNRKLALNYSLRQLPEFIINFCKEHQINLGQPLNINTVFEILEGL